MRARRRRTTGPATAAKRPAGDIADASHGLEILRKELADCQRELAEALDREAATREILRVIASSASDIQPVLDAVAENAARLCGTSDVIVRVLDGDELRLAAHYGPVPVLQQSIKVGARRDGINRAFLEQRTVHIHDIADPQVREEYADSLAISNDGSRWRSLLVVPLVRDGRATRTVAMRRTQMEPFTDRQIKLLETFAAQAVIAIENVRLFHETEEKGRQLEVANRHKSQFLASMSHHELRTPLNSIIGFSEVLLARMLGELNAKQHEYLTDIHSSGQHLLSLINDILDVSKVEAGRMELEVSEFHLPSALGNAMTLVRDRAQAHGIALALRVDESVGYVRGDERKVKQIVLNLLSNAVKFTPDGGRVEVEASLNGGAIHIAVADTGPGIALEDQAAIFEAFTQVGRDLSASARAPDSGWRSPSGSPSSTAAAYRCAAPPARARLSPSRFQSDRRASRGPHTDHRRQRQESQARARRPAGGRPSDAGSRERRGRPGNGPHAQARARADGHRAPRDERHRRAQGAARRPAIGTPAGRRITASVMQQDRQHIMRAGFDGFIEKPISLKRLYDAVAEGLAGRSA